MKKKYEKIRILDENAKWWRGEPITWAYEDRRGDWWLLKDDPKPKSSMKIKPKTKESSNLFTVKHYIFIFLSSCLGVLAATFLARYILLN